MQMIFSAFVAAVGLSFMPTGPSGPPAEAPSRHIAFYATGQSQTYGLWLHPFAHQACGQGMVQVFDKGQMLAQRPTRGDGAQMLRLGAGFARGLHRLTLRRPGCALPPGPARIVRLGRSHADPGWRGAALP